MVQVNWKVLLGGSDSSKKKLKWQRAPYHTVKISALVF